MSIGVDRSTRFLSTCSGSFSLCYNFVLTSTSLSERPLLCDIMGGSLKFRLAMLVAVLSATSPSEFRVRRKILNCWVMMCNEGQDSHFCVVFVEESPCTSFKFHPSRYGCLQNEDLRPKTQKRRPENED